MRKFVPSLLSGLIMLAICGFVSLRGSGKVAELRRQVATALTSLQEKDERTETEIAPAAEPWQVDSTNAHRIDLVRSEMLEVFAEMSVENWSIGGYWQNLPYLLEALEGLPVDELFLLASEQEPADAPSEERRRRSKMKDLLWTLIAEAAPERVLWDSQHTYDDGRPNLGRPRREALIALARKDPAAAIRKRNEDEDEATVALVTQLAKRRDWHGLMEFAATLKGGSKDGSSELQASIPLAMPILDLEGRRELLRRAGQVGDRARRAELVESLVRGVMMVDGDILAEFRSISDAIPLEGDERSGLVRAIGSDLMRLSPEVARIWMQEELGADRTPSILRSARPMNPTQEIKVPSSEPPPSSAPPAP